jgi:hypothetical protein
MFSKAFTKNVKNIDDYKPIRFIIELNCAVTITPTTREGFNLTGIGFNVRP